MPDTAELELAPAQAGEPPMKQLAPFDSFKEQAEKLRVKAETITVTDINDVAGMKLAYSLSRDFANLRFAVRDRHKELKEHYLVEGRRIDAMKNELYAMIEPLESRLKEQSEFAERELVRIQNEKREARTLELTPFLSAPLAVDLGLLPDNAYAAMLSDAKDAHAAKLAREQKEREEAAAKIKAEAEERERIRLENERLKKEAAEREEAARKEREAAALALAKEREEAAERERVAAEKAKVEADKARKEREAIESEANRQREAREKLEREAAARAAAEKKLAAEKLRAEKVAAAAPDKVKLKALAARVSQALVDDNMHMSTEAGQRLLLEIKSEIDELASWIGTRADGLDLIP